MLVVVERRKPKRGSSFGLEPSLEALVLSRKGSASDTRLTSFSLPSSRAGRDPGYAYERRVHTYNSLMFSMSGLLER